MGGEESSTLFRIFAALRAYAEGIALAVLLALILRSFILTPYRVPNNIMAPNLLSGDFVMAYRPPYGVKIPFSDFKLGQRIPRKGDLVVFPCLPPGRGFCVRRVVGLPGDRVEVLGERLIVNGETALYQAVPSEAHGYQLTESIGGRKYEILISGDGLRSHFGPVIVGPETVFVLSDHRDLGEDSRHFGAVPVQKIEARVAFIWLSLKWPTESAGTAWPAINWARVFHSPD